MKRFRDLKEGDLVYFYNNNDRFFKTTVATVVQIFADTTDPEIMYLVNSIIPYPVTVYASEYAKYAKDYCIFSDKEAVDLFIAERQQFLRKMTLVYF